MTRRSSVVVFMVIFFALRLPSHNLLSNKPRERSSGCKVQGSIRGSKLRSEDAALESNKSFDPTESHRIDEYALRTQPGCLSRRGLMAQIVSSSSLKSRIGR